MRTLLDMVKEYQALLERKDELATLTKETPPPSRRQSWRSPSR